MRPIDADELKETLKNRHYNSKSWNQLFSAVMETIDNAPTVPQVTVFTENADERAVADMKVELQNVLDNERPKGEWKTVKGYDGDEYYECSNCGEPWVLTAGTPKDNNMNFCPNCGAKMKGHAE